MSKKIKLDRLIEDIATLTWEFGIEIWKITESVGDKQKTYLLRGLKIEMEDGIVYSSDHDDILLTNNHGLLAFLIERVSSITREDKFTYVIILPDKTVKIQAIDD